MDYKKRPIKIHHLHADRHYFRRVFFNPHCIELVKSLEGDEYPPAFLPGDRVQIFNDDSMLGLFPLGKNYGRVVDVIADSNGLSPDYSVVLYETQGLFYLLLCGLFGSMGICCLLSLFGVI